MESTIQLETEREHFLRLQGRIHCSGNSELDRLAGSPVMDTHALTPSAFLALPPREGSLLASGCPRVRAWGRMGLDEGRG